MFNKLFTTFLALILALNFVGSFSINTQALAEGAVFLKVQEFSVNASNQIIVSQEQDWTEYNCNTGATSIVGVDLTRIKSQCATAKSQGVAYAYAGRFNPKYGPKQTFYGFYLNNSWTNYGPANEKNWFADEPGFNSMYLYLAKANCGITGGNCPLAPVAGYENYGKVDCGSTNSIGGINITNLQQYCTAEVAKGNYFAAYIETQGRIDRGTVSEQKFEAFYDSARNSWIDPSTNQVAAYKAR